MHRHCGTNNRASRWTFTDPYKPDVRPGAREESASPACLAASANVHIRPKCVYTVTRLTLIVSPDPKLFICSSGCVVVTLLACGARGPGFDSRSRRYDFRDWLSPASKYMAEISLNRRKSSNNQPTKLFMTVSECECIGVLRHMQRYFSYTCDGAWICRRIEEVVLTVGLPTQRYFV